MMRTLLFILILASPAAGAEQPIAIRNATVETMAAAGRLEKATVVIRNGKIEAVGEKVAIPDDARVIDAAGGTLMPGMIDPYFEVAIAAATADAGPRTVSFGGRTITIPGGGGGAPAGFTRIADNFYPYDHGYRALPRVGLTRLNLVTGGSGQSAVIRVTPRDPAGMMDRPDGIAFVSVSNSSNSLDQIRSRLEGTGRTGGGRFGGGRPGGSGPAAGTKLWEDVKAGKTPLIVAAANGAAIVHVMKLMEAHKEVKLTVFAAGNAFAEAADAIKGRSVRALVRPNLELLPNTRDRFAPARLLHELGVDVAFTLCGTAPAGGALDATGAASPGPDNPANHDFPLFPVAMMVKAGLPRQKAMEALTKQPALALGLEASHGTIEAGKAADLVLFTGDPLDPASRLRLTLIDGRTTHAGE